MSFRLSQTKNKLLFFRWELLPKQRKNKRSLIKTERTVVKSLNIFSIKKTKKDKPAHEKNDGTIMMFAYAWLRFGHLQNSNMFLACNKERNAINGTNIPLDPCTIIKKLVPLKTNAYFYEPYYNYVIATRYIK